MVINGDIVTLSKREVKELVDRECKKRLGMSAKEFLLKQKNGGLPGSTAVRDIEMLLRLA